MVITGVYIIVLFLSLILTGLIATLDLPSIRHKFNPKKYLRWQNALLTFLVILIVYLCYLNFPVTLTLLVFFTGVISLVDILFFARKRKHRERKHPVIVENARGFFPVLCLVWVIRSFIIQPYHVPTGSLEPTVMPGDFIVVNQFDYGLRFPIGNFKMMNIGEPKRGDIVLFYWPINPAIVFVKRVIGLPGDHVVYKNKILTINGKEATQEDVAEAEDTEPGQLPILVERKIENLDGVKHLIQVQPVNEGETQNIDVTVPPDEYFMMGDNRDGSDDSRMWGFVPEQLIIGKAFRIWMSWDVNNHKIRWNRIGDAIH